MPNLALFDFDGTITSADTFTPFIHYAVSKTRVACGMLVLSPLIAAYKLGVLPASAMRSSVVALAFRGRREADIREAGLNYSRNRLAGVIRPEALERIEWHQSHGDVVVVVSASLDVYLSDWCASVGVKLICTRLEARNGILTGRYRGQDCRGEEKSHRVREQFKLDSFPIIYAYGDTSEDNEMLALAHRRYFRWEQIS